MKPNQPNKVDLTPYRYKPQARYVTSNAQRREDIAFQVDSDLFWDKHRSKAESETSEGET